MKITLLVTGKTDAEWLSTGISEYSGRISRYLNFEMEVIPDLRKSRGMSADYQKKTEGQQIVSRISGGKEMHLFDEKGKMFSSREFASFLEKKMASGLKELVLVVGGPYGFSNEVYELAASRISLSKMTFSHQMARLLCVEQIYRALTILKGEPYHHD